MSMETLIHVEADTKVVVVGLAEKYSLKCTTTKAGNLRMWWWWYTVYMYLTKCLPSTGMLLF